MRFVIVKDIQPGMCLAQDIYDSYGRTLIGANCVLNDAYIKKLSESGYEGVYIADDFSEEVQIESVITPQLRAEAMECIRNQDVDECQRIALKIVDQMLSEGNISLDLADLRSFDDYIFAHSVNVAVVCCIIGLGLGLPCEQLDELVTAALLHDLGKMAIPSEILNKPGRLSQKEYQTMKSHSELSYNLIKERWDLSDAVKKAVLYHHENIDGSGYPDGIPAKKQSLLVRIIHVADVYDALVSKRPYKSSYPTYEVTEYLMGGSGTLFDTNVVKELLDHVPLYPKGKEVSLSDGTPALVIDNGGEHNLRPIIKLFDGTKVDLMDKRNFNITIAGGLDDELPEVREQVRNTMVSGDTKYRIMIVNENPQSLRNLGEILGSVYDVLLVDSAEKALYYIATEDHPDLILIECEFSNTSGVDVIRSIYNMVGAKMPVVFTTELCDRVMIENCKEVGASGLILRPCKPMFLREQIKHILNLWGEQ